MTHVYVKQCTLIAITSTVFLLCQITLKMMTCPQLFLITLFALCISDQSKYEIKI